MQRPQYWRRLGVVVFLVVAVVWDLQAARTEAFPVATRDLAPGTVLSADDVTWVPLPAGSFPIPDLTDAVTAHAVTAGEPITASIASSAPQPPEGWWTVPLDIGATAAPGDEVLLVVAEPAYTAHGMVIVAQFGDRYSLSYRPASVAVPPDDAALVAAAAQEGLLVTAVRPKPTSG